MTVVTLALALLGGVHLPFVRARVLEWARARVVRDFGIVVDAKTLDYNLLGVSLELHDLNLSAPGDRPFLQADGLHLELDRRLFTGLVEVRQLELVHPRIVILRHRDGRTNLPTTPGSPSSQPTPLHLGIVALRQLSLDFEDEAAGHKGAVGPINLTLDTSGKGAQPGTFGPSPINLVIAGFGEPNATQAVTGTFGGRLGFDGEHVAMRDVRIETAEARLTLNGSIDAIAEIVRIEAQGRLETDLAQAGRLIGKQGESLGGAASADVTINGPVADPTVHVIVSGRDLRYRSVPSASAQAEAAYAKGRIEVKRLDVMSDVARLAATGDLQLTSTDTAGANTVHAQFENVDIDRVLDSAGVQRPLKVGSEAGGDIDVVLNDSDPFGENWWRRLTAKGSVRLAPKGAGIGIEGQLKIDVKGDRWNIEHQLRSNTGPTTIAGVVSGEATDSAAEAFNSTLAGRSEIRIDSLQDVAPLLQQAGIELPAAIKELDGTVDAVVDPRGTFTGPRVHATIGGRNVRLPDFPEGQLDATVAIDRTAAKAESLQARVGTTSITASGTYSWTGQIDGQFDLTADDLQSLARLAPTADVPVSGSARVVGTLKGTVQAPRASAEVSARDLAAYEVAIGRLTAQVSLVNDKVDVDATAPSLNAHLQGSLATTEPYRFQAQAALDASSIASLVPASMRDQIAAAGIVTATVKGEGTLQRPLESSGEIALRALDGTVSGIAVALEAPATVSVEPDALTATAVGVRLGDRTHVQLSGALGVTGGREGLNVHAEGPLSDLIAMASPAMPDLSIEAQDANIGLDLHVGGTLLVPQPSGTLGLRAASLRYADQPPLTDVAVDARIEQTRIAIQSIAAGWLGATVRGDGTLPLRMIIPVRLKPDTTPIVPVRPKPDVTPVTPASGIAAWGSKWLDSLPVEPRSATVTARITGVTTDALAAFVDPATLKQVSGSVNATVSAVADGFTLDRVRGSLVLDDASLVIADVPLKQSVPTRIRLDQGHAQIDEFRWSADSNELRVTGGADLFTPDRQLDLAVNGDIDLRILGAFATGIASGGVARSALTVKGPMADPVVLGNLSVAGGELRLDSPGFAASDIEGTITIPADRDATIALKGTVNGGPATIQGTVSLANLTAPTGRVTVTARNVTLDYPEGLQTESNADLTLMLAPASSTLSGRIAVLNGLYREPLVVSRTLLSNLSAEAGLSSPGESSFLNTLALDVAVTTAEQIRVDNNYGRLNISANLQIGGTASQPGALGRIEAEPDGEIYLAGNTYRIESLVVDLTNPRTIAPEVSFLADTRVGNTSIEISLQCSASGTCEHTISSPDESSEKAEALLFGISTDSTAADAGAQLGRLLSGELLGMVGQAFRLDTFRLEQAGGRSDLFDDPTLVAGDINPASRLTIGKRLGEHVELAYSQNLAQNGFTTTTSYFGPGGISVRALLLDDQSRSYEFRHQPQFGGRARKRPAPVAGARVASIRFSGNLGFPENELRGQLHLTDGDRFAFAAWQSDRERLIAFYQSHGFFEAHVRARRLLATGEAVDSVATDTAIESITLEYAIERGRATRLDISGFAIPDHVRQQIIARWSSAIFDGFLERDASLLVRQYLYAENRLQASVSAKIEHIAADDSKTLRVVIDPGRPTTPRLIFEGNAVISTATLTTLAQRSGQLSAWLDPPSFALAIARLYQSEGLLSAEVTLQPPQVQADDSLLRVVIREGEVWTLGRIAVDGAGMLGDAASRDAFGPADGRYSPKTVADGVANIEQRLRDEGFLNAHVSAENLLDPTAHRVNIHVVADPGPRTVLASIAIEGSADDRAAVARSVKLPVDSPLSASDLSAARKSLYQSGSYRSVDIDLVPVEPATTQTSQTTTGDRRVVARIRVENRPRYTFRYGLAVNDDVTGPDERSRNIGLAADLENRNVLGSGATLGLSARLRRDQEVGRIYLGVPRSFGLPLQSTLFLSRSRQTIGSGDQDKVVADETDISAQQTYRLRKLATVSYGYGLGRIRTTLPGLFQGSTIEATVRVSRLTGNAVIERRNDPFDPSRGWFSSANFELSRPGLGSDLSFVKSFIQQFQFVPIGHGVVIASAARVGLARTYRGETLIPSERFFAGGATSVRGYADDALGGRSVLGDAEGGAASLITNGEVRFPIYRWLRGVGFVDLGNVYPSVSDMFHTGMQVGIGGGFRLNTPVGLLRLDLGKPANPRTLDSTWTVHFGLGHAF
ncbi:MAG TPA: translocation/assembly module TamB domain-containing protein [Vicinamibacterales bacterium]